MYFCRYAYNGRKLLPLDLSDYKSTKELVDDIRNTPSSKPNSLRNTPSSRTNSVQKSAKKTPSRSGSIRKETPLNRIRREEQENASPKSVSKARKSLGKFFGVIFEKF